MNKKIVDKLVQTKERYDDIKDLIKKGKKDPSKYDEIFQKYGQTIYNNSVPAKHRKREIKQLMKEGRFEDIYFKHGKSAYNDNIYKMQQADVYNETGSKPRSIVNRIKNVIRRRISPVFLSTLLLTPPALGTVIEIGNRETKAENAIEYAKEIEKYNNKIENYANEVRSMNLTDTQVFMKVMSDMWEEIDGYGNNSEDISGFLRISLNEEGKGVCRHFADDITAKLNEINPEYNARNLVVYMSDNDYHLANINRTILQSDETVADSEQEENQISEDSKLGKFLINLSGNHAVTAVDIPGENITLILDPTNPGIGVIKDGEIYMFSTPDGKGLETKSFGQFMMNGIEELSNLNSTKLESFLVSDKDLEQLKEIYGTEAQNEALEYLENLEKEKATKAMEESYFIPKVTVNEKEVLKQFRLKQNLPKENHQDIDLMK